MKLRTLLPLLSPLLVIGCGQRTDIWVAGWRPTSPLQTNRAGSAVAVAGDTLYVIGGVDGRVFLDSVEYAHINKDGSLSAWKSAATMAETRGFTAAVVHKDYIYVVGGGNGANGQNLLRSVERARIQADGSLGPWQQEPNQMLVPRRCSKIIVYGDTLYSFGGFGGALLDTVERAPILADGSIGPWQLEAKTMTMPRYTSGVNQLGSLSFVVGGHDQQRGVGLAAVEWSRLNAQGRDAWQATSAMNAGRFELATVDHGGTVYALGGISGTEYLDSIEFATQSDAGLGAWQYTTPLSSPRASFSAALHGDTLYIIGGTNLSGYFNSVEYAVFDKQGQIGFYGSAADKSAYEQQAQANRSQVAELPNDGVVWEILQTSGYSYVHVVSPQHGDIWLAGNKLENLQVNDKIAFSSGVMMSNFYSKELQRAFPAVLFVGTLRKID